VRRCQAEGIVIAEVLRCAGCGKDVIRGERESCDRCGHIIPDPIVGIPIWEGRAPGRWYVNGYMRSLAKRGRLPWYARMQLRVPWLEPVLLFGLAILVAVTRSFSFPSLTAIWAVGLVFLGVSSIVNVRALAIAVEELRRHGLLRE